MDIPKVIETLEKLKTECSNDWSTDGNEKNLALTIAIDILKKQK